MSSIEVAAIPHAVFRANIKVITLQSIEDVLEHAYLQYRADPTYLFLHKEDRKLLVHDQYESYDARTLRTTAELSAIGMTAIINRITGKFIHLVDLPEATRGILTFGFCAW